jgi:hypothetical protein
MRNEKVKSYGGKIRLRNNTCPRIETKLHLANLSVYLLHEPGQMFSCKQVGAKNDFKYATR